MTAKKTILIVLFSALALFGCRRSDVRHPDVPVEVIVSAMVQQEDAKGSVIRTADAGDAQIVKEVVTLTGQGKYKVGETAKIAVGVKDDYTLVGYYFRYAKDYDAKKYPTDRASLLKATADGEFTFVVQADITVIAVVQKKEAQGPDEDEPLVQKEPFKLIPSVDVAYWRAQNQKAWNMIYPKIVRLSEKEEWEMIEKYEWDVRQLFPTLEIALHTDTLYSGETNLMSYDISLKGHQMEDNKHIRLGDDMLQARVAYALSDMSGNIVQIYPPFRIDLSSPGKHFPAFVDLPTGDYLQHVLIQIPEDPGKWYDLRMHDKYDAEAYMLVRKGTDPSKEIYEYLAYIDPITRFLESKPLPKHLMYWNEKTITRHVVERRSLDRAPVPGWRDVIIRDARDKGKEYRYGYIGAIDIIYPNSHYELEMNLSNKSNAYRRGTVHAVVVKNNWIAQNHDLAKYVFNTLIEVDYKPHDVYLPSLGDNLRNHWIEVASQSVTFNGEEEITIKMNIDNIDENIDAKITGEYKGGGGSVSGMPGENNYLVFYWEPEGENHYYCMIQDFSKVMNRMQERIDVPFGEWWWGYDVYKNNLRYIDDYGYGQASALNPDPNAIFDEMWSFEDGNGISVQ